MLGTEKFIQQYNMIVSEKCNISSAKISKHYSVNKISYSGNNIIKHIYNFLYKNQNICLTRKQEMFNQIATEAE
jgi:hypothetical protein